MGRARTPPTLPAPVPLKIRAGAEARRLPPTQPADRIPLGFSAISETWWRKEGNRDQTFSACISILCAGWSIRHLEFHHTRNYPFVTASSGCVANQWRPRVITCCLQAARRRTAYCRWHPMLPSSIEWLLPVSCTLIAIFLSLHAAGAILGLAITAMLERGPRQPPNPPR
jgi:hypothetical protein